MWLPQPSISNYLSSIIIKWIIKCRVFNHGMDCVNKYVQECIDSKQIVENSVYGAKKLFEYLCKEKYFQQGGKQTAQFHKVNANDGQMIFNFQSFSATVTVSIMYRKIGIFAVINSMISFRRNWPRLEHTTIQIRNIWITVGEKSIL